MSRNDLPSEKASNFSARLRETIQTMLGTRGDKLDRVITLRDLIESGITKLPDGWRPGGSGAVPLLPGSSLPDPDVYVPDLTPPPTPTGFAVDAAISNIFIEHDEPLYPQGHGHLRTRVYGATVQAGDPLPTFSDAVEISQFSGTVHAHPTNPATTWRLWIKWETNDLVLSASPAGGTNGLEARTGEDVAALLEALTGQITASQLYTDLATPIASIPGLATAAADNAAAIAQESLDRVAAISAEALARGNALAQEAADRVAAVTAASLAESDARAAAIGAVDTAIRADLATADAAVTSSLTSAYQAADAATLASAQSYAYSKAETDGAISAQGTLLTADFTAADAATLASANSFTYARSTIDAAITATLATLRAEYAAADTTTLASAQSYTFSQADINSAISTSASTLRAQLTGGYTGTDLNALTTGLLFSERQARSTADATEVTARQLLSSRMLGTTDPSGATLANVTSGIIFDEKQTRATADTALTNQISVLSSTVNNNTAAISAEASTRASADSANASAIQTVQSRVANAADVFTETWTGPDPLSRWQNYAGTGELSLVSAADATGGTVLRVGNNSGNDQAWLIHRDLIPFDPAKTYRGKVRIRRTAGVGTVYAGWAGVAADGITLVSNSGGNTHSSQHYHIAGNQSPGESWTEYTGYTKGHGATSGGGAGTLATPGLMHPNVRYLRLLLLVNYSGQAGTTEVDSVFVTDGEIAYTNATIQTEATTRATETGELYAQYTVKTDVAGLVSGYGLASTANNAAPTSSFGVRASNFYVAPPSVSSATAPTTNLYPGYVWLDTSVTPNVTRYYTGTAWSTTPQNLPFIVQTAPTTINGVAVPAGVYMRDAYIQNGTITNAKIANLAVDDAKIANLNVSKLVAGSIAVGQHIQSTGYIAGSAGWRINGNGTAEFSGVVVRGTVYATAGLIGGITIASDAVRAGQTAYNTGSGFHLGSDGRLSLGNSAGNNLTWDGTNLNVVGGGTFSGDISAASGTFTGNVDIVGDGKFSVRSATSGARMETTARAIKVFDASGVKRVQLGDLTL